MTPAAAGGMVAGAVGLFCLTFRAIRPLARLIGFALVVLGLAILGQDLFGFDLGLDQALVRGDSMAAGAAQSGEMHLAPGITGLLILFGLALLYAKQGGLPRPSARSGTHHRSGSGSDCARRLRLRRRHLLLSVPVHLDVGLWRDQRVPALAGTPRGIARIRRRRGHRRAIAGGRNAPPPVTGHPRAASRHRLVRPSGRGAHLLRQLSDARHLRRAEHSRARRCSPGPRSARCGAPTATATRRSWNCAASANG